MTSSFPSGAQLGPLPVFPLPQAVLFPKTRLPLHIFEPRYRAMTRDALDGDRLLVIALVTDEKTLDEHGHPPVAGVCGIGEIVDHDLLPDGRFNLLVQGRARVHIQELPFTPPYRQVSARVVESHGDASDADVAALVSAATRFAAHVRPRDPNFELSFPDDATPADIADACAHHLIMEGQQRQMILETLDIGERVRRAAEALAVQHALFGRHDVMH